MTDTAAYLVQLTFQTRFILEKEKPILALILYRECKPVVHTVQLCNREHIYIFIFIYLDIFIYFCIYLYIM